MKISLRTLLLIVAICALALGWSVDHVRLQNENARLNKENADLIGRIMPSSGFAVPSGLSSKAHHSYASPEDRKELLFMLDNSLTHGKGSNSPFVARETPPEAP